MKTRVVVAMSGGVDSSVAVWLLKEKGYEVIGVTMCFGLKEAGKKRPSCCGIEGIDDARKVAYRLGIKHYTLNFDRPLQDKVINNFISEYLSGRTPNPCVRCNQYLKFEHLLTKAKSLGAEYLATGHYASIDFDRRKKAYTLNKAKDRFKDQSYFLYRLNQKQMSGVLMPLGCLTKDRVRKIASSLGLPVADKPASQEICFIPGDDYRLFIRRILNGQKHIALRPGPILDTQGRVLGQHKGIPFYTIGQREGLGIARGFPIYIVKIDVPSNCIIVGERKEAVSYGLIAGDLSFTVSPIERDVAIKVKIRYNHKEITSKAIPLRKNRVKLVFSKPQFAVTPGQSAVFYKRQQVLGGGIIEKSLNYAEIN